MKQKNLGTLLILSLLAVKPALAVSSPAHLAQEFEKTKISLMNDEIKQRKVLGALFEINRKMKKIVGEKAELEQQKLLIESNVKELAVKITELEQKTKTQKVLLRERMAAIYKLGGQGLARLLFSSNNSAELERNLKILGIVAVKDINLIRDYAESKKELDQRKQKLTQRWAHLKKLENRISKTELSLTNENKLKGQILGNIRKSQKFAVMKIKDIRKKSREIASQDEAGLLDSLFQASFFEQKGQLPMPVPGRMIQGFGLIKNETHNVVLSHKGQFYQTPIGTPVKAVFHGKVAFAGEVPGFGKTLILDHGDHYYSVYSHNSAFQVNEGDEVKQLQVLAQTGRAESNQEDGLYFEIRHFSEPADPKIWMKGTNL